MYEVVIVKADYEGWWLFEDWQKDIIKRYPFDDAETMQRGYINIVSDMTNNYNSYLKGKYELHAFFNACEIEYCEDCDDEVQIYYTPMMTKNNEFIK